MKGLQHVTWNYRNITKQH